MIDPPEFSVIVPLYNKGPYIARSLKSILNQTFQNFEVIVVDDGSTDNGAEIVMGFIDPRIKIIKQGNLGVSAARNRGIEAARAELVAFLDSDDEWLPKFLETIFHLRKKYPKAGIYATGVYTEDKGKIISPKYRSIPSFNWEGIITDYFKLLVLGDSILRSSSVAIPRKILNEMKGFAADAKWGEDLDLWGRIALNYQIGFASSCCSIIYNTCEGFEKISTRVKITKENPFIKSASDAIKERKNNFINKKYLMLYIDKLIIDSALFNAIIGQKNDSNDILRKCRPKVFFLTKMSIIIWNSMPACRLLKSDKFRKINLSFLLYLRKFEMNVLAFIVNRRFNLR